MQLDWQTVSAIVIVLGAIGFLVRRVFFASAQSGSHCGSCSNCPANSTQELVRLK